MPFWKKTPDRNPGNPYPRTAVPVVEESHDAQCEDIICFYDSERRFTIHVQNANEAKQVIKRLRLKKKEVSLIKRNIALELKQMKAERAARVSAQGRLPRGKGLISTVMREMQRSSRESQRSEHGHAVLALELRRDYLDEYLSALDRGILEMDRYILEDQLSGD